MACSLKLINTKNKNQNNIVKLVKTISFEKNSDLVAVETLTKLIFEEWDRVKNKYRAQLIRCKIFSSRKLAAWEAEQELVVGLIGLLNTKIIEFVFLNNKD